MDRELWTLFCETGDPMSYLLYKALAREQAAQQSQAHKQPPEPTLPGPPSASD